MAKVSIIIPTKNNSSTLPALLESVKRYKVQEVEVIIVDAKSDDGTDRIAQQHSAVLIIRDCGRAEARNLGARVAKGDYLFFVDSDMALTRFVLSDCLDLIEINDALCIGETVFGNSFLSKVRKLESKSYFRSVWFEAARFFRRSTFFEIGGYDEGTPTGLEDIALQAKLLSKQKHLGWVDAPLIHNLGQMSIASYLKKHRYYSQSYRAFSQVYPAHWSRFSSPIERFKVVLHSSTLADVPFLIGWIVIRGIEFLTSYG
ncbi:MAG: glycosyltransferase [Nitrososphaerota archaeon]|nr:glycosyltransferase [Nitrososphaerota archaeon]